MRIVSRALMADDGRTVLNKGGAVGSESYASVGLVFYLFGIFCAYWAQTTGRSAWTWFFVGWFFAPIAGLVLLKKNANRSPGKPQSSGTS
jgi:hypothetical protein